ncbi:MAG TPA: TetR/AcrR family transcriptional regulator [Solirubrobacteraceae bacterium]|jgi:AcrR family transcriptional regulator|nr:TetR/AcrR family transcriptional regulator [Solirubrobacteraceae bacterium]
MTDRQIPPSIELAWGLRERGTRGPKRGLTLEGIVAAGIDVAARDGLDAVSMAGVAQELGAGTMSLYRYVSSKDELLTLMVDTALGPPDSYAEPVGHRWRAGLDAWAHGVRRAYNTHRWTLKVPITSPPLGPNNVAWMERALSAMAETPLSEAEKLSTLLLLSGFVRNHATLTADLASGAAAAPPAATYGAILSQLADEATFPAVHRAIASGELDDDDEDFEPDFEYGLARILDGVQALIARKRDDRRRA